MKKPQFTFRLSPQLLEKINQIAEDHFAGDKSATAIALILTGIDAMEQGKDIKARENPYELPENVALAVEHRIRELQTSMTRYYDDRFTRLEEKVFKSKSVGR